jgi:hypothetical protein
MALANISNKIISRCDRITAAAIRCCKVVFSFATIVVFGVMVIACTDPNVQEVNTKLFWVAAFLSCLGVVSSWKPRRNNENTYSDIAIEHGDPR